jgi:anti-sigma B factor antagonist
MEVKINNQDGVATAQLIGRLDTPASQEIGGDFENLMQYAAGTVILDCTQLEYISSSGLRLFLSLRKAAASKGGKVIVKAINNDIRSVFMMTGFLNLFEIQD